MATWPVFPLKPSRPPPARTSTPPGLPSFGSPEAIRLMTLPGLRGYRHATVERDHHGATDYLQMLAKVGNLHRHQTSGQSRIPVLRRANPSSDASSAAAAGQPPTRHQKVKDAGRVYRQDSIARADDGTYVRGRFAARSSGHGVGARTNPQSVGLEGHPFIVWSPQERLRRGQGHRQACEDNDPQALEEPRVRCNAGQHLRVAGARMVIPEEGGPSRGWGFWQSCWSDSHGSRDVSAAPEAAGLPSSSIIPETGGPSTSRAFSEACPSSTVDTWDFFPPWRVGQRGPGQSRCIIGGVGMDRHEEHVSPTHCCSYGESQLRIGF